MWSKLLPEGTVFRISRFLPVAAMTLIASAFMHVSESSHLASDVVGCTSAPDSGPEAPTQFNGDIFGVDHGLIAQYQSQLGFNYSALYQPKQTLANNSGGAFAQAVPYICYLKTDDFTGNSGRLVGIAYAEDYSGISWMHSSKNWVWLDRVGGEWRVVVIDMVNSQTQREILEVDVVENLDAWPVVPCLNKQMCWDKFKQGENVRDRLLIAAKKGGYFVAYRP